MGGRLNEEEKGTPIGPYKSKWADKHHFIIKTKKGVAVVANGMQPHEGTLHPDLRSAKSWMKENGFSLKEEGGAGDEGSDEVVNKYKSETPGQSGSSILELIQRLMKEKKEKDALPST